jgi:hypothetical protein
MSCTINLNAHRHAYIVYLYRLSWKLGINIEEFNKMRWQSFLSRTSNDVSRENKHRDPIFILFQSSKWKFEFTGQNQILEFTFYIVL